MKKPDRSGSCIVKGGLLFVYLLMNQAINYKLALATAGRGSGFSPDVIDCVRASLNRLDNLSGVDVFTNAHNHWIRKQLELIKGMIILFT